MDVNVDFDEQLEKLGKIPRSARYGGVAGILVAILVGYFFIFYQDARNTLDDRERQVIRLCFGLGGSVEMTLEQIGLQFRLTRERVRQIKEKALRKLRHPTRGRKLIPYSE